MYAGTNNLHQLPEAASIAQIIINGNYSDEQDDYDIALMRLSKPLALSGACIRAHTRRLPAALRGQHLPAGGGQSFSVRSGAQRSPQGHLCVTIREAKAQRLDMSLPK